jgi:hypothetical protein
MNGELPGPVVTAGSEFHTARLFELGNGFGEATDQLGNNLPMLDEAMKLVEPVRREMSRST